MNHLKTIVGVIFFSVIVACGSNTERTTNDVVNPNMSDNEEIFGSWTMCSMSGENNTMIQMNVCPKVVFSRTGNGSVIHNDTPSLEVFKWTLKGAEMKIVYNNHSEQTFPDTTY